MKKTSLIILQFIIAILSLSGQEINGRIAHSRIPEPSGHYLQEYTFDSSVKPSEWRKLSKGLHIAFANTSDLYFRTEVPQLDHENTSVQNVGWKGERINNQILVWSSDSINQIRVQLNDLKSDDGSVIGKNNLTVNMIRYVITNYPYAAKNVTCGASPYKDLFLLPDRFESFERFDLPGKTVRPLWLSVNVPISARTGIYHGNIKVESENHTSILKVEIRVQSQVLPPPHEWKHRLDLWQNPWVVAQENNLIPWSDEHLMLLKKHLKIYAEAGGKYITTYGVHSPWSDNSYMTEGTMIEWIKRSEGNWKFDYKIFDKYVNLAMSLGIDKAITLYSPAPWGFRFRYLDEKTGNYIYEVWDPGSMKYKSFWNIFLNDFKKHLTKKGWFNKTYIGINENELSQTLAAIKVVKNNSKDWKITYAGNWHKELNELLDDYCFLYGNESDTTIVKTRRIMGKTTTYYVCCNPPYPNNFVFSPPIEGRWISWYSAAHKYDGFLRWAYDAWPADPMRDSRHQIWPSGDCFMVYPGGNSCIRFEKLREGIIDFEKIRILRQKALISKDKAIKTLWMKLEEHLKVFLNEKEFNSQKIAEDVKRGIDIINLLSDKIS